MVEPSGRVTAQDTSPCHVPPPTRTSRPGRSGGKQAAAVNEYEYSTVRPSTSTSPVKQSRT